MRIFMCFDTVISPLNIVFKSTVWRVKKSFWQKDSYCLSWQRNWRKLNVGTRGEYLIKWWCVYCSHKIKRHLLLRRKALTNLDSVLKSRDIILLTKVCIVKAMVFLVAMYGCESWTIKKAERGKIDAFELWCWRRLLRVPWTARRSNQSILKEINPEYSLEGLRIKPHYFGHLMWRFYSLEKTLMLGKTEGSKRKRR